MGERGRAPRPRGLEAHETERTRRSQLPEKSDDAITILRLAIELAEGFLADSDKPEPAKVLTIVRDPA